MDGKFHDKCFVCGKKHKKGLKLEFRLVNNTISGEFRVPEDYQGYDDILHGGIIAAILDSSMVNLFYLKEGMELKTAKLNVRYKKQIPIETKFTVIASAGEKIRKFSTAKSQIKINNMVYAEAEGYFK